MTSSEKLFHQITENLPNAIAGKMFAAKCIKAHNGKTAAFLWSDNMVFKLDKQNQQTALKLQGSKMTHPAQSAPSAIPCASAGTLL